MASKKIVKLRLLSMNPELTQYKPINLLLGSDEDHPVVVGFEVDAKNIYGDGTLMPSAVKEIAEQMGQLSAEIHWALEKWNGDRLRSRKA